VRVLACNTISSGSTGGWSTWTPRLRSSPLVPRHLSSPPFRRRLHGCVYAHTAPPVAEPARRIVRYANWPRPPIELHFVCTYFLTTRFPAIHCTDCTDDAQPNRMYIYIYIYELYVCICIYIIYVLNVHRYLQQLYRFIVATAPAVVVAVGRVMCDLGIGRCII